MFSPATIQQSNPNDEDASEKFISGFYVEDENGNQKNSDSTDNEQDVDSALDGSTATRNGPTAKGLEFIDSWLQGVPKGFLREPPRAQDARPLKGDTDMVEQARRVPQAASHRPKKIIRRPRLVLRKKIRIPRQPESIPNPTERKKAPVQEQVPEVPQKEGNIALQQMAAAIERLKPVQTPPPASGCPCKLPAKPDLQQAKPIVDMHKLPAPALAKEKCSSTSCSLVNKLPTHTTDDDENILTLDKRPAVTKENEMNDMKSCIRKAIQEKVARSAGTPPSTAKCRLSDVESGPQCDISTGTKEQVVAPVKECHKSLEYLRHSCPDNGVCFISQRLPPSEISKQVSVGVTKAEPQYVRSTKPVSKLPFLEEELKRLKIIHEQDSNELATKSESELIDSGEFGFIPVLRAFIVSLSKIISKATERSVAMHDKKMLQAECEILKHALPQTFIDTMFLRETRTITTAYSVTIPKVIQCMTFETRTATALSMVTRTVTVIGTGTGGPEIPSSCHVRPECLQCPYEPPKVTECVPRPFPSVDIMPTAMLCERCPSACAR